MWSLLILVTSLSVLYLIIRSFKEHRNGLLLYLVTIIFLRFFLSAFHEITFNPVLAGLSINGLFTILIVFISILIIPTYLWTLKVLIPIYFFLIFLIVSSVVNREIISGVSTIFKWLYLCIISLLVYETTKKNGIKSVLEAILKAYYLPIFMLILSVVFGKFKASELDGTVNYIGGYNHEAVFSVMVITFMAIIYFHDKNSLKYQSILITFSFVCLYIINYRTALVTIVPLLYMYYSGYFIKFVPLLVRPFTFLCMVILSILFFATSLPFFGERFIDIYTVITSIDELFTSDIYYTRDQQRLFSGRVYFWSQYLSVYVDAPLKQILFGFGPDSWKHYFRLYAHNTYVSYLFEFGIFGLTAFLLFFTSIVSKVISWKNSQIKHKILTVYIVFFILNMATMPIWQIEGLILLGILCGVTWAECFEQKDNPKIFKAKKAK